MGNIYHEWNGTTLIITSDSGTSAADLKGEQGNVGIRGPQGPASPGVVIPNPTEEATQELEKVTIGETTYSLGASQKELATKLDKKTDITTYSQAYVKSANGTDAMVDIDEKGASKETIVKRNGAAKIVSAKTTASDGDSVVTTKSYVDDIANTKVDEWASAVGGYTTFRARVPQRVNDVVQDTTVFIKAYNRPLNSSLALYNEKGVLKTNVETDETKRNPLDCANLQYVDDNKGTQLYKHVIIYDRITEETDETIVKSFNELTVISTQSEPYESAWDAIQLQDFTPLMSLTIYRGGGLDIDGITAMEPYPEKFYVFNRIGFDGGNFYAIGVDADGNAVDPITVIYDGTISEPYTPTPLQGE